MSDYEDDAPTTHPVTLWWAGENRPAPQEQTPHYWCQTCHAKFLTAEEALEHQRRNPAMTTTQPPAPKRGRGRPKVGPYVRVSLPEPLLADLRAEAGRRGTTVATEIRRRLEEGRAEA